MTRVGRPRLDPLTDQEALRAVRLLKEGRGRQWHKGIRTAAKDLAHDRGRPVSARSLGRQLKAWIEHRMEARK